MSMYQRDLMNQANVTLSGTWAVTNGVTIDVVQASVDGGDWFTLTMNSDGTFTGTTSLMGGMHDVQYQALDASGTVLATKSGQVGVGEIFITAGESNATNNGSAPQYSTSSLAFSYNPRTGEWQQNEDPQQGSLDGSNRGSMWPSFTDKMAELEGVPIATYSVGYKQSTIAQWNNNTNGIYGNLQAAMDFLNENAEGFAGILWQQGESDKGTTQQAYIEGLNALIARTRADSGNPNLPWGVAIASADGNGTTYSNVTNAQQQVIDGDSYVFQGVNADGFPSSWRVTSDNYRYLTADGLLNGGQLWATMAGESIIDLRKYWFVTSNEAIGISNWEVNGGYKLGVKLVSGTNLSVEADNSIQMLGAGAVEVAENYNLTLSGDISGSGELTKTGKGTLVLSGDFSAFTGKTTVADGTLKLAAGGTLYDLSGGTEVESDDPDSVYNPVNLVSQGDLTLNSNSDSDTKFIGKIDASGQTVTKTGDGTLKIYSDINNVSKMDNFVVEAGRLDFKGYFEGSIDVEAGAVLSPGNSIGTLTIDGEPLPENVPALILRTGSTLLMEVADPSPDYNDKLIVDGNFTIEDGAIIELVLDDNHHLAPYDTFEVVIQADGTSRDIIKSALTSSFFTGLDVRQEGSTYTITGIVDPNAVPEPSTWALLILGAAGLLYMRKRNK